MTSERSLTRNISILGAFALSLAALTVVIAIAATAQQAESQPSAKSSATPATESRLQTKQHDPRIPATNSLSFLPAVQYDTGGDDATSVAVADVNGDGKPDIIVANICAKSTRAQCGLTKGSVAIFLGNGDGTFLPAVNYGSSGVEDLSVAVADFNGDGKLDLVVTNVYGCLNNKCPHGSVDVRLGNGDGTFQPSVAYDSGGAGAWSVAVADVNGDGKLDLVVANAYDSTVSVLLGKGDGTFSGAVVYNPGGLGPVSVAVADVNRDGKLDLVLGNECAGSSCLQNGGVGVLLGNGDGTFLPAVSYSSGGSQSTSVAVADVNGDGKLDIVVANYYPSDTIGVLLGNGDGTFQSAVVYDSGGQQPYSVAVADVNLDGKPDLLVANIASDVAILLGNGDGTFQSALSFQPGGVYPQSIVAADLNGDGKPDLVVATNYTYGSNEDGGIGVLLNNTTVVQSTTSTALTSSLNPSVHGQSITWTATVTTSGSIAPTGTVNFKRGPDGMGTGTLNASGVATFTTSILKTGPYKITAVYKGDASNLSSTSAVLHQGVKH